MISVVVPIYNEVKNVPLLFDRLHQALTGRNYELIGVNDGSRDGSLDALRILAEQNKRVRVISFSRNFGQTAAISAGILSSRGEVIVLIDADLENDPADIPKLLDKLEEGYDLVSGWRKERWKGQFITRRLPSVAANKVISHITGIKLHDFGCTLKAYRKEIIRDVRLYGQMHRFIPVYSAWQGAKVAEVPVGFTPRIYGKSHYGMGRIFRVVLDLILLHFLERFMNRPIHFFGGAGFWFLAISVMCFLLFAFANWTYGSVVLISGILFALAAINSILIGIVAEVLMRTFYESQGRDPFIIEEKINFGLEPRKKTSSSSKNIGESIEKEV